MKLRRSSRLSFLMQAPGPCVRSAITVAALGLLATGALAQNVWTRSGTNDWYGDVTNWSQGHFPLAGEDVVITNASVGVLLTNAAPASGWLSSLTVSNTATLIFSNWTTALSATNVTVLNNGTITCIGPFATNDGASNRVYLVCSNLFIGTNAGIDVNARGYGGNANIAFSAGYGPGGGASGPDSGLAGAGGGGYGGLGGSDSYRGGAGYGNPDSPIQPGSGGGRHSTQTPLGDGGGAIRIDASGTVTVNGTIAANGRSVANRNGGGSGGGISIGCSVFAGTNGTVTADGGSACQGLGGGGGAGGRIAVQYTPSAQSNQPPPTVRFSVNGGYGYYGAAGGYAQRGCGDIGTLYFPDASLLNPAWLPHTGKLIIPNFPSWSVDSLTVSNGWLQFTQDGFQLTVTNNLQIIGSSGRLDLAGSISYTNNCASPGVAYTLYYSLLTNAPVLNVGKNLILTNGGTLFVFSATTNGVTPDYGALVSVTQDVIIAANSWFCPCSHATNGGSVLVRARNFGIVQPNAGINANGLGYIWNLWTASGNGFGPGAASGAADINNGGHGTGGGGYGGSGGSDTTAGGMTNGLPAAPSQPGSSGGRFYTGYPGGSGGGLVRIEATGNVLVNGTITANGTTPLPSRFGGGSGGGVFIRCNTFAGTNGLVSADGGSGSQVNGSGGGGGGRIAIIYTNAQAQSVLPVPTVRFSALGGYGYYGVAGGFDFDASACGDIGTLYLPDTTILNPAWLPHTCQLVIPGFRNWSVNSLTVSNGWLRICSDAFNLTVTNDLTVMGSTGRLELAQNFLFDNGVYYSLVTTGAAINVGGNLILTNGGRLAVFAGVTNLAMPDYGALVNVTKDVIISSNSWIYPLSHMTNGGSPLFRMNNLTIIPPNSGFNADWRGFGVNMLVNGGNGYGYGGALGTLVVGGAGGGGYGGAGGSGNTAGGGTYGSSNAPVHPGSGGGRQGTQVRGGYGGGLVRVVAAGTITLNGTITANGRGVQDRCGGGSGGGIYIRCKTIAGANGVLTANGGAGWLINGGAGGGGGRIALWRVKDISTPGGISNSVAGGVGFGGTGTGANGTVVWVLLPPPGTIFTVY